MLQRWTRHGSENGLRVLVSGLPSGNVRSTCVLRHLVHRWGAGAQHVVLVRMASHRLTQRAASFADGPTRHHCSWPTPRPRWAVCARLKTRNRFTFRKTFRLHTKSCVRTSQNSARISVMVTIGESAKASLAPLTIIRAETVLSRFPIHTLSKTGGGTIHIRKNGLQGTLDTRWEVSYNARYGPPRQLAYKLDTLVINQKLDALGRPLPTIIKLGSLAHICSLLGVDDGGGTKAEIKKAFHQNAGAYIVATLRYQSSDDRVQTLDAGFHRYSVVFTGEQLPNGTKAD